MTNRRKSVNTLRRQSLRTNWFPIPISGWFHNFCIPLLNTVFYTCVQNVTLRNPCQSSFGRLRVRLEVRDF